MNKEKLQKLILQKRLEKTWQNAYKEISLEGEEKSLDYICEHIEFKEKLLNDLYVKSYQLQHELLNIDIMNIEIDEGLDTLRDFMDKFEPIEKEYYENVEKVKDNLLYSTCSKIRELGDRVLKLSAFHVTNYQDKMLLIKKSLDFKKKMANMTTSFNYDDLLEGDEIFRFIRRDTQDVFRLLTKRKIKQSKESIKEFEKIKRERQKYSKIFDYKEMCRYAIQEGYELCRQGATDHQIYKFVESGRIVVIPTHSLGYGLMKSIKKQIKENKVV